MTEHLVLDAAWGWPDLAAAKKDGYSGIIGYLSDSSSKNLTPARVKQARALGMSVNAVWEDGAADFATWTQAECSRAGTAAANQKVRLGLPARLPVFAAVDAQVAAAQFPKIGQNILTFARASGGAGAVYGEAALIDYLFAHKIVGYGWQPASTSWSDGKVSPNACLLQRVSHTRPKIAGDYDENVVLRPDFGAWMPAAPVVKPPAKTVPTATTPQKVTPAPVVAPPVITVTPPTTTGTYPAANTPEDDMFYIKRPNGWTYLLGGGKLVTVTAATDRLGLALPVQTVDEGQFALLVKAFGPPVA